MKAPIEVHINDIAQMRKPHPCGGDRWQIVRLGADIGMRCLTCNHKVLLPRTTFERRLKQLFDSAGQPRLSNPGA